MALSARVRCLMAASDMGDRGFQPGQRHHFSVSTVSTRLTSQVPLIFFAGELQFLHDGIPLTGDLGIEGDVRRRRIVCQGLN